MTAVNVRALANLARLEVSDEELGKLEKEIPAILAFVETIQKASTTDVPEGTPILKNVMRDDANPHKSGAHTEDLLAAAPTRKGDYVAVKQVISRKK